MSRLVFFCALCFFVSRGSADVASCYACAGPLADCTFNKRPDFLKMDCSTFKVDGNKSLIERSSQSDLLELFDSEVAAAKDDSVLGCITLTFTHESDSPKERALKSCVPAKVFNTDICTYMEGAVDFIGGQKSECHFCKSDDCNSAISNMISVTLVTLVLVQCISSSFSNFCFSFFNYS
nr:PREDICTED: uncharacterized protein LOC103313970 [Tribolium castaneum]|eukprot:XP_008196834.1 PREDICTED: uncharacterized protein LOC103313970 [Tribolium castaneum]